MIKVETIYLDKYAKLGSAATLTYLSICRHARNNICSLSMEGIAQEHGINRDTVSKGLKLLQEYNIITINKRREQSGNYRQNEYYLIPPTKWRGLK